MPAYVVDRAIELLNDHSRSLKGARVLVLGVSYKPDVADQRESPARVVARKLRSRGAVLAYHDPHVTGWAIDGQAVRRAADLYREVVEADLVRRCRIIPPTISTGSPAMPAWYWIPEGGSRDPGSRPSAAAPQWQTCPRSRSATR